MAQYCDVALALSAEFHEPVLDEGSIDSGGEEVPIHTRVVRSDAATYNSRMRQSNIIFGRA